MKKIVLVLLVVLISGCHMVYMEDKSLSTINDKKFHIHLSNIELFYIEVDIHSLEDIGTFMQENIVYKSDGDEDVWSTPEDTYKRGYGDCEDLALLFINMAYTHLDLKFDLVLVDMDERLIIEGDEVNHAEASFNGESYSIWSGRPYPNQITIRYLYSFDDIFNSSYLMRR